MMALCLSIALLNISIMAGDNLPHFMKPALHCQMREITIHRHEAMNEEGRSINARLQATIRVVVSPSCRRQSHGGL